MYLRDAPCEYRIFSNRIILSKFLTPIFENHIRKSIIENHKSKFLALYHVLSKSYEPHTKKESHESSERENFFHKFG